jgi:hypothetical protein
MRVMHRIELEHMNHGGAENGRLIVTFDQFVKWGLCRRLIAPAIRELAVLGFLEVTEQGHAGAAGNGKATRFRLTYVNCKSREQPTDEWRRIDAIEIAKAIVSAAKREASPRARDLGKRSWSARMKKISVHKSEPTSVHESEPDGKNLGSRKGTTRLGSRKRTTIYNLGGLSKKTEQSAELPWRTPVVFEILPDGVPVNALASAVRVLH